MGLTRRYLYGITRSKAADLNLGCVGLEVDGEAGRVYAVSVGDLAWVVSPYGDAEKVRPLRKNLMAHHGVIRKFMEKTSIIPMTFGHVAADEENVRETLRHNQPQALAELQRLDHKVEMCVKATWAVENIFEHFLELDPDLAEYRDRLFGRSNAPSQTELINLGQMFEQRRAAERKERIRAVVDALEPHAASVKVNQPKGDTMVMNLAFLVDRDALETFEAALYAIAGEFPAHFDFEYNGPWAPFSFVELDLESATAE